MRRSTVGWCVARQSADSWLTCLPKWELGSNNSCHNGNWVLRARKTRWRSKVNFLFSYCSESFPLTRPKWVTDTPLTHHQHITDASPTQLVRYKVKKWPMRRSTVGWQSTDTSANTLAHTSAVSVGSDSLPLPRCSRINMFSITLNTLLRMLLHVFYEQYTSHSACYVWLRSFLKMNASFLRCCCLIWKCKQHTFETFFQIK